MTFYGSMSEEIVNSAKQQANHLLEEYLHLRGLRLTAEREAIVDAIYDCEGHFAIEALSTLLEQRRFRVSLATLYNNMEMLVDAGLVWRHYFCSSVLYERSIGTPPHFHRICMACGQAEDYFSERLAHHVGNARIRAFKTDYSHIYLYGICTKCAAAQRRKNKKLLKQ